MNWIFIIGIIYIILSILSIAQSISQTYTVDDGRKINYTISQSLEHDIPQVYSKLSLNKKEKSVITYSFISLYFEIDSITSRLYAKVDIDRETICKDSKELSCLIEIPVTAFLEKNFEGFTLKIYIKDINDNIPTWPENSYTIEIKENCPNSCSEVLPLAFDPDSNEYSVQSYKLNFLDEDLKRTQQRPFEISYAKPSSLRLLVRANLDREMKSTYKAELIEIDGGYPPKTGTTTLSISMSYK